MRVEDIPHEIYRQIYEAALAHAEQGARAAMERFKTEVSGMMSDLAAGKPLPSTRTTTPVRALAPGSSPTEAGPLAPNPLAGLASTHLRAVPDKRTGWDIARDREAVRPTATSDEVAAEIYGMDADPDRLRFLGSDMVDVAGYRISHARETAPEIAERIEAAGGDAVVTESLIRIMRERESETTDWLAGTDPPADHDVTDPRALAEVIMKLGADDEAERWFSSSEVARITDTRIATAIARDPSVARRIAASGGLPEIRQKVDEKIKNDQLEQAMPLNVYGGR